MDVLKPVRWSEGLFLRPQHFQQWELYLEARESMRLAAIEPFGWGLIHCDYDLAPLDNFVLSIRRLRAVFPEGALVDVPTNAELPGQGFEQYLSAPGSRVLVSLGLRRREDRVAQTSETGGMLEGTRFSVTPDQVSDLESGEGQVTIDRLRYQLRFFFGDEPTLGHETVPLMRLARTGEASRPVVVDQGFAPPALVLAGSPFLLGKTRDVASHIIQTVRNLKANLSPTDVHRAVLFQALSGAVPVLRDLLQDGQIHPRVAFCELARLAGSLLYRDDKWEYGERIPTYDHRDPGPGFEFLQRMIERLSKEVPPERWSSYAFSHEGDYFHLSLPQEATNPGVMLFLVADSPSSEHRIPAVMESARISTADRLPERDRYFLPGVNKRPVDARPEGVPLSVTGRLFRLFPDETSEWRDEILPAGNLAVALIGTPPDLSLSLGILAPP